MLVLERRGCRLKAYAQVQEGGGSKSTKQKCTYFI